jgi:hypothetical protein
MIWRVFAPQLVEYDATRQPYVLIQADQKFVSASGVLQLLNVIPEPIPEPVDVCAVPTTRDKTCVRVKGHTGKHMDKLKPKFHKPKLESVEDFNAGAWMHCAQVKGS